MPRSAAYEIELSAEERHELERRAACYTLPFKQVQRARLVLYAAEGQTNREIARRLDMNEEVSAAGDGASSESVSRGSRTVRALADRAVFPPEEVTAVKPVACELPHTQGVSLSRFSRTELHRLVIEQGVTEASASTIWRWLSDDALRPWQQRSWVFPARPRLPREGGQGAPPLRGQMGGQAATPGRVRDLSRREDPAAGPSAQAPRAAAGAWAADASRTRVRAPRHARLPRRARHRPPREGKPQAQAVRTLRAQGRHRGLRPARRAGHDHRALRLRPQGLLDRRQPLLARRQGVDQQAGRPVENLRLVHLPYRASWLNQIEIYFSILQHRRSRPRRSTRSPRSPSGSRASRTTGSRSPSISTGTSPAATSTP
jgi:hypothetical protein